MEPREPAPVTTAQPTTLATRIADAVRRLCLAGLDPETARREAERLLAARLGRDRGYLQAWPEAVISPDAAADFADWIGRRVQGEPIAYILGRQGFWDLDLHVGPGTLIPRPETEELVAAALEHGPPDTARVLDLGCGSGAIALALARTRPQWTVVGVDRSEPALAFARANRNEAGLDRVALIAGDWLAPVVEHADWDVIVSNPPYVAAGDPHLAEGDLRFEPLGALVAGPDGLAVLEHLITRTLSYLRPGGWLILEHGWNQGASVQHRMIAAGWHGVTERRDLAGHPRVAIAHRPS